MRGGRTRTLFSLALLYYTTILLAAPHDGDGGGGGGGIQQRRAASSFECGGENEKKKELVARLEHGGTFLPCNPNRRSLWRGARCEAAATTAAVAVSRCSSRYYIVPVHSSHHPLCSLYTHSLSFGAARGARWRCSESEMRCRSAFPYFRLHLECSLTQIAVVQRHSHGKELSTVISEKIKTQKHRLCAHQSSFCSPYCVTTDRWSK